METTAQPPPSVGGNSSAGGSSVETCGTTCCWAAEESTLAMNAGSKPSTCTKAFLSSSPTPWPGAACCFSASTSFWLANESTSTLFSRSSRGLAVKTTIQAFSRASLTTSRISVQASLTCASVTGPTGTETTGATGTTSAADWAVGVSTGVAAGFSTGGVAARVGATAGAACWGDAAGAVAFSGVAARVAAMAGAAAPGVSTPMRRSRRSTRASAPRWLSSLAGTRMRAIMSSRWSLGDVAPVISVRAALTTSAALESSAWPNVVDWAAMRSSWSWGTPLSTDAALPEVAATMMRSRSRSSRSSTNRRGSWPVWMTRSTDPNAAAASRAPRESTTSSSRAPWV